MSDAPQPAGSPPQTTGVESTSAAEESHFHTYTGNRIPWYVRLIWVLFWVFAVYYVISYLFPDLQAELLNPP